ncbi:unnamed protein product [Diatraea saccharalis]|uniref:Uncharacterized protein n=1 Tax=Diatraea saccharalis TaxID=40085 RepID=A0A9N9QY66_9NEOP|nr:unnamed protein product [Diatraea saccharalis]
MSILQIHMSKRYNNNLLTGIIFKLVIIFSDKIELGNISRVIYEIIDILICDAKGEPNKEAIKLLFKCILPKLVSASVDCRNANNLVRASYVTYSGLLLSKYSKAALSGYSILLQHLCYTLDGLERAEVRSARVSLVVGLMSLLPHKSYRSTVKWLLKLSTTSKISHRQIALEMLSTLLSNEPEEKKPDIAAPEQPNPHENQGFYYLYRIYKYKVKPSFDKYLEKSFYLDNKHTNMASFIFIILHILVQYINHKISGIMHGHII